MSPLSSLLLLHLPLHIILLLSGETYSQTLPTLRYCTGDNYTSPSSYETQLRFLLSNLTNATAESPSLFSTHSIGTIAVSQVFGLAQCRPDASPTICNDCLHHAAVLAVTNQYGGCGSSKSAVFRYDKCYLRYSDIPFFGNPDEYFFHTLKAVVNASDNPVFGNRVQGLVREIIPSAIESKSKYAAAAANNSGFETTIFGMVWCTMDIQSSDCLHCLNHAAVILPTGTIGGEVASVSCTVRFSTLLFFSMPLATPAPPLMSPDQMTRTLGRKISIKTVLMGVLSGCLVLILFFTILLIVIRKMRRKVPKPPFIISNVPLSAIKHSRDSLSIDSMLLDMDAIRTATNDFSIENKLGEGGFGVVYKGVLNDGKEIAVKRLSRTSKQGLKQLRNEVGFMSKLQHRNLVKVLGCCLKDEEKLLVYEYLPNNSLDKYLSDPDRLIQLDWRTRYKIIQGIGRGLLYLHEDSIQRIIHRDLKASNILLDMDMNPKISDFGIAKLFNRDETRGITSHVSGTFGYMSPEYALHGKFSPKSDVYSYGVLVLEIIAGRSHSTVIGSETALDLLSHVWNCWNQGMALQVIDQSLGIQYSSQEALTCIHIGLLCIQEDPALRPSMSSLLALLNTNTVVIADPLMPTFLRQVQV